MKRTILTSVLYMTSSLFFPNITLAQTAISFDPPVLDLDNNSVDPLHGFYKLDLPKLALGSGEKSISYQIFFNENDEMFRDSISGGLQKFINSGLNNTITVQYGEYGSTFTLTNGIYEEWYAHGDRLQAGANADSYIFTKPDGLKLTYSDKFLVGNVQKTLCFATVNNASTCWYLPISAEYPDGRIINFDYEFTYTSGGLLKWRKSRARSNFNWDIAYSYVSQNISDLTGWQRLSSININRTGVSGSRSVSIAYSKEYSANSLTSIRSIQYPDGRTWQLTMSRFNIADGGVVRKISNIVHPGGKVTALTYNIDPAPNEFSPNYVQGLVKSINDGGVLTTYSSSINYGATSINIVTEATDANNGKTTYSMPYDEASALSAFRLTKITNQLGNKLEISRDKYLRISNIKYPDGQIYSYEYNVIGKVSKFTINSSNQNDSPISKTVTYNGDCSNYKICVSPIAENDFNGSHDDVEYSPDHGGVISVTSPSTQNAGTPLVLTSWEQRSAPTKDTSGSIMPTGPAVWVKSSEKRCRKIPGSIPAVCDNAFPQTIIAYEYGANGTNESLLVKGIAITSGSETLRTCYMYDQYDRKIAETNPRAGLNNCP